MPDPEVKAHRTGRYWFVGVLMTTTVRAYCSISLGIKSQRDEITVREGKGLQFPAWLNSAVLFSLAETLMPLVGLAIGYATSLFVSHIMHVVGPLILIGVGLWELLEEGQEYIHKKRRSTLNTSQ